MAFGVLKVSCGGQIHRVLLSDEPSFDVIDAILRDLWPGMRPGSAKYVDSDGDLCILVEGTFEDLLTTSKTATPDRTILKITIADEVAPAKKSISKAPEAHGNVSSGRSALAPRRRAARSQVPESTWQEDERDLDELLSLFDDEPEPSASLKRKQQKAKRKEARAALKQHSEAAVGGVDAQASQEGFDDGSPEQEQQADHVGHTDEHQEASDVDYWDGESPNEEYWQYWGEGNPDPDAQYWGVEEAAAWESPDWADEDRQDYSNQTGSWHEDLAELLRPPLDLPRAASCPCTPTWRPLLDDEEAEQYGRLDEMGDPSIEDFFDDPSLPLTLWPPTPGSTPSATPRYQYHDTDHQQQVIWVPVPVPVPVAACSHCWRPPGQW